MELLDAPCTPTAPSATTNDPQAPRGQLEAPNALAGPVHHTGPGEHRGTKSRLCAVPWISAHGGPSWTRGLGVS